MKSRKLGLSVNLVLILGLVGTLAAADRSDESQAQSGQSTISTIEPVRVAGSSGLSERGNAELFGPATGNTPLATTQYNTEYRLTQILSSGATNGSTGTVNVAATFGQPLSGRKESATAILVQGFWSGALLGPQSCCFGQVGDADGNGIDIPDIADVAIMIDNLYITGRPLLCIPEADVNQSGGFDPIQDDLSIADVSVLVDFLFISGPESYALNECL